MNENLSQIVADLVKAKGDAELSSAIQRLRDEIKKGIDSPETVFGKIHGLVESLREIIPDEKQRYSAAIKALSTTAKLGRKEIAKAFDNQLMELKILEKGLMPGISGWRDELRVMQAASQEMRDEISKLRDKIVRLEIEEKVLLNSMETREKEIQLVEKAMKDLFEDIGADITAIKIKVAAFTSESAPAAAPPVPPVAPAAAPPVPPVAPAAAPPVPPAAPAAAQPAPPAESIPSNVPSETVVSAEPRSEILESAPPQESQWQKKCPMCGGRMDFNINGEMWICYTCAYEEPGKAVVPAKSDEKRDVPSAAMLGFEQKSDVQESAAPQDTSLQKQCPMCGGRMDFNINGEMWICYTCAHEEGGTSDVPDRSKETREQRTAPEPPPASEASFESSSPFGVPLTDLSDSEFQEPKKASSPSKHRSFAKTKPCPSCRKKMSFHESENMWRCPHCEYERRI